MRIQTLAFAALLAAAPVASHATDKIVHLTFDNAVKAATASGKLDGSVKFYLAGNAPSGDVSVVDDNVDVSRKTNGFGKRSQVSCDWVLQSVLIALQDDAKKAGANAVIDIVSNYDGNEYRDAQNYECHVGFLMSGVELKAKLAKVH
ncbi:excinuclease [Rhodanobacter sp. DHG33]|uniref:excinuclease n=1 Tax=Rhodanobacter sp. DHG33 TaxID=2775921 RepID=UPI0017821BD2|nr:excinuclease [Rhodanobacter sp. DHG33]MBD8898162.1 excinuclease [Rhodanobacter sp. DHG33]